MLEKQGYIYIMTNKHNNVLYVGVISNLQKRVYEHKHKLVDGFTKNYNIDKLVYYEVSDNIESAILREKQFKAGSRKNKMELIIKTNPDFNDLYDTL